MSQTETIEHMATKPVKEHEWLNNLVGEWRTEGEMIMPDGNSVPSQGRESVRSLNGLWALGEGEGTMPDGSRMVYYTGLGYDVSFKEYRGFWLASVSSHLWKYTGELSPDGRVMTLSCEGPHMERDGETALYRDVIELVDENHRILRSYWADEAGNWNQMMTVRYTRV